MDDGRSRVLAEGQFSLTCHLCIAQKGECHVLVVVAGFWVAEYLSHLLVVGTAQQEVHIAKCLVCQHGQCFGSHLEDGLALKLSCTHALFAQEVVLCVVFAQLKHWCILEFWCCCHS